MTNVCFMTARPLEGKLGQPQPIRHGGNLWVAPREPCNSVDREERWGGGGMAIWNPS